jgi:hypothetical protein
MPVRSPLLLALFACLAFAAPAAAAPPVSVTVDSVPTTGKLSVANSPAAYRIESDYDALGLRFSDAGVGTAIFQDTAAPAINVWGGIGADGTADFVSPIQARIVLPGTGGQTAATARVVVEAGYSDIGQLELEGYDCLGRSLGKVSNTTAGGGPHGRSVLTLAAAGSPRSASAPPWGIASASTRSTSARRRRAWWARSRSPATRPAWSAARRASPPRSPRMAGRWRGAP